MSIRQKKLLSTNRTSMFLAWISLLMLLVLAAPAFAALPQVTFSRDNTPISYEIHGSGDPTLVFVHGWSGDSRYWRMQVEQFSRKYKVVVLDLAGHGHSGMTRGCYSPRSFAEDVRAVVEATGSAATILIGHSMGGEIVALAATMMPEKVIGVIGVDTLDNIEYPLSRREAHAMIAPMVDDFFGESRTFVSAMFRPDSDPAVRQWVLDDISAAPPFVALGSMESYLDLYVTGAVARIFDTLKVPVICVNGDLWPVNVEANRRHIASYETITVPGGDHFLMLNQPNAFNKALEQAIFMMLRKVAQKQ